MGFKSEKNKIRKLFQKSDSNENTLEKKKNKSETLIRPIRYFKDPKEVYDSGWELVAGSSPYQTADQGQYLPISFQKNYQIELSLPEDSLPDIQEAFLVKALNDDYSPIEPEGFGAYSRYGSDHLKVRVGGLTIYNGPTSFVLNNSYNSEGYPRYISLSDYELTDGLVVTYKKNVFRGGNVYNATEMSETTMLYDSTYRYSGPIYEFYGTVIVNANSCGSNDDYDTYQINYSPFMNLTNWGQVGNVTEFTNITDTYVSGTFAKTEVRYQQTGTTPGGDPICTSNVTYSLYTGTLSYSIFDLARFYILGSRTRLDNNNRQTGEFGFNVPDINNLDQVELYGYWPYHSSQRRWLVQCSYSGSYPGVTGDWTYYPPDKTSNSWATLPWSSFTVERNGEGYPEKITYDPYTGFSSDILNGGSQAVWQKVSSNDQKDFKKDYIYRKSGAMIFFAPATNEVDFNFKRYIDTYTDVSTDSYSYSPNHTDETYPLYTVDIGSANAKLKLSIANKFYYNELRNPKT